MSASHQVRSSHVGGKAFPCWWSSIAQVDKHNYTKQIEGYSNPLPAMVQELVHFAGSIFSCSMMVLFKNWALFFGSHLSSALHGFLKVFAAPHVSFCGRWPWSLRFFVFEDAVSGMYQTTCKYQAGIQKNSKANVCWISLQRQMYT